MAHELYRLSSLIFNTPHLMEPAAFESVAGYIIRRTEEGAIDKELAIEAKSKSTERDVQFTDETQVGVIPVTGPLTYIEQTSLCMDANSSYQQIKADFDSLVKMGATTIVLDADGPGGQAYGCFETAQYMRTEADRLGIRLIAYVDGLAASATYGIVSAAHEVITNPDSEIGSVGVLVKLRNVNKALEKMGVTDTYITAGDEKIPFDASGDWKPEFLADVQEKVNVLYGNFIKHVSDMRGISAERVKSTQAKTFLADKALELGLVDRVMTREQFFEYLADVVDTKGAKMLGKFKLTTKEDTVEMVKLEELQAALATLQTKHDEVSASLVQVQASVAERDEKIAELTASLAEATGKLEAHAAEAAAKKVEARKVALAAVLPEDQVESTLNALAESNDAAFEVVLGSLKTSRALEKNDPMFKEVGNKGNPDKKESAEMTLLKQKYQKQ